MKRKIEVQFVDDEGIETNIGTGTLYTEVVKNGKADVPRCWECGKQTRSWCSFTTEDGMEYQGCLNCLADDAYIGEIKIQQDEAQVEERIRSHG